MSHLRLVVLVLLFAAGRASAQPLNGNAGELIIDDVSDGGQLAPPHGEPPARVARNVDRGVFSIFEENDAFSPGTDEFYTQGLLIQARFQPRNDFMRRIINHFFNPDNTMVGLSFGQNMYTPEEIAPKDLEAWRQDILPLDRPYAGITSLGMLFDGSSVVVPPLNFGTAVGRRRWAFEFDFAVAGPYSFASEAQAGVHQFLRRTPVGPDVACPPDPQGWKVPGAQIDSYFGVNASGSVEQDLVAWKWGWLGAAVTGKLACAAGGFYDNCAAGMSVSFGFLGTRLEQGEIIPESKAALDVPNWMDRTKLEHTIIPSNFHLFVFARGQGRGVLFNRTLDNNFGPEAPGHADAKRTAWVADGTIGVSLRLWHFEGGYSVFWRTNELSQVPPPTEPASCAHPHTTNGVHSVGQIYLSIWY